MKLRRFVSVEWLILWMWIVGTAIYFAKPYSDPDTPWHYATGLYILAHHTVPTKDVFSWSSLGQPWVTQEWLFETAFVWIGTHFGFIGTWLMQTIIETITLIVLYCLATKVSGGNRVMAAVLACAGIYGGMVFWTMRPQMVSYMMFAIFLLILQYVREGHFRVLWFVPPLILIWANAHGSSEIGILVLLLEVAVSFVPSIARFKRVVLPRGARWRLTAAAVVGGAFGLINPNGIKAYTYALLSTNSDMTDNIMEWHSPNFHAHNFKYGILPFILILLLIVIIRYRSVPIRELLFAGGSLAMFLVYQRFLPYLAIAAVPLLASMTSDWVRALNRPSILMRLLNGILAILWIALFIWKAPPLGGPVSNHWSHSAYPVGAVQYLKEHHLTKRVLNLYAWGGYMILEGVPTFVDGRTDIFLPNHVFMDYMALQNVWWNCPDLLQRYNFQAAIFPSGESIVTYLTHAGGWHVVYSNGNTDVLVPNQPTTSGT